MADSGPWAEAASVYGGNLVVWIDQASDPGLIAANSNGVCHAITIDWISADMMSRFERGRFVNAFRNGGIPGKYLDNQARYASDLGAFNSLLDVYRNLQRAHPRPDERPQSVRQSMTQVGQGVVRFRAQVYQHLKPVDIPVAGVHQLRTKMDDHTAYYMFSMRGVGSGHVVGFEQRAGVGISDNYPSLYEFLDANLGLFAFTTQENMIDFFVNAVWPGAYRDRYGGGRLTLRRISLADVQEGMEHGEDLGLELDALMDEAERDRPTGAFWRVWETSLSADETCWRCGKVHGQWRSAVRHWHRCRTCSAVYCPGCGWALPRASYTSRERTCTLNDCGGRTALV